jgi:hypothetical protein
MGDVKRFMDLRKAPAGHEEREKVAITESHPPILFLRLESEIRAWLHRRRQEKQ